MTRPTLYRAKAGQKNTAYLYNDNFDKMLDYIDESIDAAETYVDQFMPSQTGNSGKFLTTNGTSTSWVNVGGNFPYSGYIDGLVISKISDDTISVSIGSCYDITRAVILSLDTATSKQNSSQAPGATYNVFITMTDGECDININNGDAPSGSPTYYRLIGCYYTDGDGKIKTISSASNSNNGGVITETYTNGESGYRKYADGFIEQWGTGTGTSNGAPVVFDFLTAFTTTNYNFQLKISEVAAGYVSLNTDYYNIEKRTNKATALVGFGVAYYEWLAIGY